LTSFFVDTSALAKRYIIESGSNWVLNSIEPAAGNLAVISKITFVEMRSVLRRRVHERFLTPADANLLWTDFSAHVISEYVVIPVNDAVISGAARLIEKHSLRTLDAIQLSSSLQAQVLLAHSVVFVSADNNLLAAATAEGLQTDNPNLHP
jgi:predicted nucleic acid-binding protein